MDMIFNYKLTNKCLKGRLLFNKNDNVLYFENLSSVDEIKRYYMGGDVSCILFRKKKSSPFNSIEISFEIQKKVLMEPSGIISKYSVVNSLPTIEYKKGEVYIEFGDDLAGEIGYLYDSPKKWDYILYDKNSGWFYFGPNEITLEGSLIEFAVNSVVCIFDNKIQSMWLKPIFK